MFDPPSYLRTEGRCDACAKLTITVENRRRASTGLKALTVNKKHRNLCAVFGGIPHLFCFVAFGLKRDRIAIPKSLGTGDGVIAVNRIRGSKRGQIEATLLLVGPAPEAGRSQAGCRNLAQGRAFKGDDADARNHIM